MKLKKLTTLVLSSLILVGCTQTNIVPESLSENKVKGIPTENEILDSFSDETISKLDNLSPYGYYDVSSLLLSGTELPSYSFTDINGNVINTSDLKGKKTVIEIVAPWCGYCSEFTKTYLEKIEEQHQDIDFIQIFGEGTKEEIEEFYKTAEVELGSLRSTVIVPDDNTMSFVNFIKLQAYPSLVFIDEDGIITWSNSGLATDEDFNALYEIAYGEKRVYQGLKEGVNKEALERSYEDVKSELTQDAQDRVLELVNNDTNLEALFYQNLGKTIEPDSFYTIDEKTLNWDDIKDKKVVYSFLPSTNDETVIGDAYNVLNDIQSKYKDFVFINIILNYGEETPTDFITINEIELKGYTVDGTYLRTAEDLYNLAVYYVPTIIFTDNGGYVTGSITGELTEDLFKNAVQNFYGDNAIATQISSNLSENDSK